MQRSVQWLRHAWRSPPFAGDLSLLFDKLASAWVTETARDPLILGGVTLLLAAVGVIACLAPARRAASIDPMHALRNE